jgi:hypothetical protein
MIISIINHTAGEVSDEELQGVIRAINRQISEDYEPYWSLGATLRLEGRTTEQPDKINAPDMRGDAVIYLWNQVDVPGALGYHDLNNHGIAFGFVFTELSRQLNEPWSVTLSHEALELIGDPDVNLLVMGPHPDPSENRDVFFWYEMCDAVQAENYLIDDVAVSNFVLPLYFTGGPTEEGRNDFLGRAYESQTLPSFGINPGGYVGFFDPVLGNYSTYSLKGDRLAAARLAAKSTASEARRVFRYQRFDIKATQGRDAQGEPAGIASRALRATTNGRHAVVREVEPLVLPGT